VVNTNVAAARVTRTKAQHYIADVQCDEVFWSHDGQTFKNLQELALGLITMDDETYMYHANNNKNDFAHWVREVVGDNEMARELESAMSRTDASEKVTARVSYLNTVR
jgi:hypothetical protein